jgi:hypothetical protein
MKLAMPPPIMILVFTPHWHVAVTSNPIFILPNVRWSESVENQGRDGIKDNHILKSEIGMRWNIAPHPAVFPNDYLRNKPDLGPFINATYATTSPAPFAKSFWPVNNLGIRGKLYSIINSGYF